jgi:predicted nicotinamide N-methyase
VDIRDGSINSSSQDVLLGVQTWGSASILAQLIASSPQAYLPLASSQPLRVLELGAGTGLVSLAAARILENRVDMSAEIVASDHDLTVIDNLRSNITRNSPYGSQLELSAVQLDWQSFLTPVNALDESSSESSSPLPPRETPFDDQFDVIFGADIVYEPHQAFWIKATVSALLKRPRARCASNEPAEIASDSRFHLVIPLRETHESESASVLATFPLLKHGKCGSSGWSSLNGNETHEVLAPPALTLTLATIRTEEIEPQDRRRPMRYLRCEIGWAYL